MRSREAGFTLIEILIVMAIIATLGAAVMAIIPYAQEKARQSTCQNNLRQMGTILVTESTAKRWPTDSGAGFLLRLYLTEKTIQKEIQVFVCPGDQEFPYEPGSQQHRDLFRKLDANKTPLEDWDDHITSYAGRNVLDYPIRRDSEEKEAIASDRTDGKDPHHDDGVMVLFSDGKVEFLKKASLGVNPEEAIMVGPGGPSLLEKLCFRP